MKPGLGEIEMISSWNNFWFSYIKASDLCCDIICFSRAAEVIATSMHALEWEVESVEHINEDDAHYVVEIVPSLLADMF